MPSKIKIAKEDILNAAFDIVRKEGLDHANVREIAKKLNCSVQLIYYQFQNVEELKLELMKKIQNYFYEFLTNHINDRIPAYKQTGINYIKFAKTEPKLFQILFMSDANLEPENLVSSDDRNYKEYEKIIETCTNLDDKEIKGFHIKMWIFTHGIATLVASQTCKLNDEQISELLTSEFQALMLAEEKNKDK